MIRLIVKGNQEAAMNAAGARLISTMFIGRSRERPYDETLLDAPDAFEADIYKWFNEPSEAIQGQGYPPGTLLHFSRRSE